MSYNYHANAFPDPVVNLPAHSPYPTAPVSNMQNHGLSAGTPLPTSPEVRSQALNYSGRLSDPSAFKQQILYAQSPSLGNSTQYWNSPPGAAPLPSSFQSGLYVNAQTTLGQQQEHHQQRYSLQNSEYHQASHPQQHPQHTLPTPSSSAHDNTHPDSSCQTFSHPPPFPTTGSQDARCSAPATTTRVLGSLPTDMYQPPAFTTSYDERHKISDKVLRRMNQPNMFQSDQQLCQAQVASTYDYPNERDPVQSSWPMPPSSFNRRSSSLAHALEPVPSNTPAQQNGSQIKFEELITSQSHNVQSAPSSQSQSPQAGSQATIYPFSSTPGSSKTNSCHVVIQRPRPNQPSMPSSSSIIQIPKLPPSPIKQPPNKLSASPPSTQWSSPGSLDSKDNLRQRARNVAVIIPPSTMQRMPLSADGAPIASMLVDAVANGHHHLSMPTLEQAVLPKPAPSKSYPLPLNAPSMSIQGSNAAKLVMQQQIAAVARKRGVLIPQPGGTSVQHYSPYMVAKEQRDGRKMDMARLAEMHAATVSATGMGRRGSSSSTGSSSSAGAGGLMSSTALFPPPVLVSQHQVPQTIAIGSGLGGSSILEESPSSLSADDGLGKDAKLGKKPFLACEFCRHRKIACGKGPTLPPEIVLPPGPRTCNQCFRRGLECQFPEASRRGLRHGKPSRRVIYGANNEYRIVDPEEEDYDDEDDEGDYFDEVEEIETKGKGKGKAKVPARPWSPIRFVPAVDTEILKELSKKGVIERGGYV